MAKKKKNVKSSSKGSSVNSLKSIKMATKNASPVVEPEVEKQEVAVPETEANLAEESATVLAEEMQANEANEMLSPAVEDKNPKKEKAGKAVEVKAKDTGKDKKKKDKVKKPNKLGKAIKDTGSELKKVTWPKFGQVCKQTGIVLAVVIVFALVLLGFDQLCMLLHNLLMVTK